MIFLGGIEAGGKKFVWAIGNENGEIIDKKIIPTTTPEETLTQAVKYFKNREKDYPLASIGIGSFGPIELDQDSPQYGYITTPPKPGWGYYNFVGNIKAALKIPVGWDTDVNAAALGEHYFGAAQNIDTFLYVTVGTGIGAGGMLSGKLMHGLIHPEMGHIFIPHDKKQDKFAGICPFHGDCLEGLASGPAIQKRWGVKSALDLPAEHPAWELEAEYLAAAFVNYILILSIKKIIVGGGVMKRTELLPMIRAKVKTLLNGYIKNDKILNHLDDYIVTPTLVQK